MLRGKKHELKKIRRRSMGKCKEWICRLLKDSKICNLNAFEGLCEPEKCGIHRDPCCVDCQKEDRCTLAKKIKISNSREEKVNGKA